MSATDPIPYGCCHCGCGEKTPLALRTDTALHRRKGEPIRFVHGHNGRKTLRWIEEDCGYATPCHIWQLHTTSDGHGRAVEFHHGPFRMAHILRYEKKHGPLPPGVHLHHRCEQPSCVNPDHLEPMTPTEHRQTHSRLTWDDVREIRRRRAAGERGRMLAAEFGISESHLCTIFKGNAWKET